MAASAPPTSWTLRRVRAGPPRPTGLDVTIVLLLGLAALLAGIAGSLVLLVRTGETRVALLTALFALLGARQGAVLTAAWGRPFTLDATGLGELAVLAACVLGLFLLVGVWRTLAERDRVELMHWNGMEVVRLLADLSARQTHSLAEKIDTLLEIGCARLELEIGMVSRINKGRYEIIGLRAPVGFPVSRDAVFALEETYCGATVRAKRPLCFESASEASWANIDRAAFGFGCYLGAAIRVGGTVFGTLSFGAHEPRAERFTGTEKDLANLMAQWLAGEIERERSAREAAAAPVRPAGPWRTVEVPRGVNLNAVLRRLEKKLRSAVEPAVELELSLADELAAAHAPRVPLETIIRSLVLDAVDAMPEGGRITLSTRTLDVATGEPGVLPAVAPNRYVTLSVHHTGDAVDADGLAHAFEPGSPPDERTRLPLASIYRMLHRCNGDLSVDVQPGSGTTFTLFLPLAPPPSKPAAPARETQLRELSRR